MSDATTANSADQPDEPGHSGGGHGNLTWFIVGAIVLAVVVSLVFPRLAMSFEVGGQIFLRLLQMVVVPLVMASVMSGILGLGDVRKLGRPGGYAVAYYMCTTVLAVFTGLAVVNVVNPGVGIDKKLVEDARREGAREVDKAASALEGNRQEVTWDFGTATSKRLDGVSDEMEVDPDEGQALAVRIVQVGKAQRAAEVVIEWSPETEGEPEFRQHASFQAGVDPGVYRNHWPIPPGLVRLHFQAQQGGQASTLSARVVPGPPGIGDIFQNLVLMLFTNNLLESMVEINLLPLIVFSIVFAGMLTTMGQRSETIAKLVISINDALMSFILLLMKVAPLGIFCLVASRFGKAQADGKFVELLNVQAYYIVTVLVGLGIHGLVTLPAILYIFTRRNPYRFIGQMSQAVLTAFSTASSTATLPVTMECAETNAGISKRSTEFVLPLGATINMDGTALYEAAAAIFIAQAYAVIDPNFNLTLLAQLTIAVTATLAAIGAAGIPEAGLVTMLIVLNAVNLPLELIGLILPVDWLLDRFRTAVNAFGDSVGAAVVEKSFPD